MEILLNELSLNGQFTSEEDFLDNLNNVLVTIKLLEVLNFNLLKNYTFFNSNVTATKTLSQIMRSRNDRVRKIKSYLLKLSNNPPFWNDTQKHSCIYDTYTYSSNNICDTSLAESSKRDKIILSFNHNNFLISKIIIKQNSTNINIYNIVDKNIFLDELLKTSNISPINYCLNKYKNTKLNFTLLNEDYGFDILNSIQIKEYLHTFDDFVNMSWQDILESDSLKYKKYDKPKKRSTLGWFRYDEYHDIDIYKFRTSQLYRCFGYRENDIFYVLRFEIDHKISDNG